MSLSIWQKSRASLSGMWGMAIVTSIVYGIVVGIAGATYIGLLVTGHMMLGISAWSLNVARGEKSSIEDIFTGFKNFVPPLVAYILYVVIVFAGTLLLIIPGIIAALGLSLTFYILAENPEMEGTAALKQSWEMMKGHKGELFVIYIQFFLLGLLCLLTLGIGFFFLAPYTHVVMANFYLSVKGDSKDAFDEEYIVA